MTANTFGILQCTVSKIVVQVCTAISTHLSPKYIHLPKTENEMRAKVAELEAQFGMVQAFGSVDGTHIPIRRPIVDSQDCFNYKQFFSISVQAVCDFTGYFMDVNAKVFSNSFVKNKLQSGKLPQTFNNLLPGYNKIPNYLIGDPAYPLTAHCTKEFQSCKTDAEVIFYNMLRSARNPIVCIWPS